MAANRVRDAALRAFDRYALYGISVHGVIDQTLVEAFRTKPIAAYRHVRLSTFGRVRNGSFALLATFDHPHFTLVLPDLSELTIARLRACFDDPIPNPSQTPTA